MRAVSPSNMEYVKSLIWKKQLNSSHSLYLLKQLGSEKHFGSLFLAIFPHMIYIASWRDKVWDASITILWSTIVYPVNNGPSTGETPGGGITSYKDRWGRERKSGRDCELSLWGKIPFKYHDLMEHLKDADLPWVAPQLSPNHYLSCKQKLWWLLLQSIFAS